MQKTRELTDRIRKHSGDYYAGRPSISDVAFDELMGELREAERKNPDLAAKDSPTNTVGDEPRTGKRIKHAVPLLSLKDIFEKEDVTSFVLGVKKRTGNARFVVEPKIDGLSVSAEYRYGKYFRGLSRRYRVRAEGGRDHTGNRESDSEGRRRSLQDTARMPRLPLPRSR
jgi:DNA ligase (NAD+)